jgi:tRNA(adenine34) deaminase
MFFDSDDDDNFRIKLGDEHFMNMALRQAEQAYQAGEVPIGAIIVHDGEVIAKSWNQVEMLKDATAHAEILALTQAASKLERWRLHDCTLYVTKEPCPMCAGALVNSRIKKVVFGLPDAKGGGCGGAFDIHNHDGLLHKVEIEGSFMEEPCKAIIQSFFKMRRQQQKDLKNNESE